MSVRYQLMANNANRFNRGGIIIDNEETEGNGFGCQNSKNCCIFIFLVTVGFIMYLPFIPFSSNKPIAFVWPANQSRDAKILLRPNEDTTRIWPSSSICKSSSSNASSSSTSNATDNDDLILLVVVLSAMKNFRERQAIRESWASDTNVNTKVIFLLGHIGNDTSPLQVNVSKESDEFDDIIQEDFIDSYANLTVKSLMLLKWYTQHCHTVPYVLKTDDDVYINLKNLFQVVETNKKPNLLLGTLICGATPIRDPYNKWYAPYYMYDKKRYPNYLSGTAYLMSRSTALTLYEAALQTPVYHMEDIYITGILSQASGIRPQDNVGFSYVKRRATPCLYAQTISSHHLSINEMLDMHKKVKLKEGSCAKIKRRFLRSYGPGKCVWSPPKKRKRNIVVP